MLFKLSNSITSRMKAFYTAVLLFTLSVIPFGIAQTPEPNGRLLMLIKEVDTQQAQITANQGKIESKLTEIAETIRVARIFSSRSN
jgi:hypothetical protein